MTLHRFTFLLLVSVTTILSGLANPVPVSAQTEAADFSRIGCAGFLTSTVSDYQCVGINPANLGVVPQPETFKMSDPLTYGIFRKKRNWSFGLFEGGVSLHSDALNRSGVLDMLTQTSSGTFSDSDKVQAARNFANRGIRFSAELMTLGAAYQSNSWGGLAVTVRERISGTFRFNTEAAQLVFEGRNFSYFDSVGVTYNGDTVGYSTNPRYFSDLFNGTQLSLLWYRELGLSYGVELVHLSQLSIYAGIGAKYLLGYALMDARVVNGNLHAQSALSPVFGVNYGKASSNSLIPGNEFIPVGTGYSVDIGITMRYKNIAWSASVVDVGMMVWDGNVFMAQDTILNGLISTGFSSYNIFQEAPKITGDGNYFKWVGAASTKSTIPARVRIGTSYTHNVHWTFGFDAVFPVTDAAGSLGEPIVSIGADWRPTVWLKCGTGFGAGGNMGSFIPASVLFSVFDGMWELGIASRDLITLITTNRPIISMVVGAVRLRL